SGFVCSGAAVPESLARRHGEAQPVLTGRDGAAVDRVVDAVRVVGPVEVERVDAVGRLGEVEVAAAAVGGGAGGEVLEGEEEVAGGAGADGLEDRQGVGAAVPLEAEDAVRHERAGLPRGRRHEDGVAAERGAEADAEGEGGVVGEGGEAGEARARGGGEGGGLRLEQPVAPGAGGVELGAEGAVVRRRERRGPGRAGGEERGQHEGRGEWEERASHGGNNEARKLRCPCGRIVHTPFADASPRPYLLR